MQKTKSSAVWQRLQCRLQCRLQSLIQCRICYEDTLSRILSRMRSRLRLGHPELHNYDDNWRLQIDFRIKPFQSILPKKPYEISRRRSNAYQKRGMTVPESQPLPQTITVLEVQERSTVRYIHQFRRLAAASAPGDDSTSGLRERR